MDWPDCRNTRDLGGLPTASGTTRHGVVIRSDNISSLTPAGVRAMWEYGVNTVIDLRSESEVAKYPSPFASPEYGPRYVNLPVIDDAFAAKIPEATGMAEQYQLILDYRQRAFGQIFSALAQVEGPAVVHCYAGKDRTGLVAAMLLSVAGVGDEAVAADYAETDVHLAARYVEWLAAAPEERKEAMREDLRCPPEWMIAALSHIQSRWGGVSSYLEAAGMSAEEIVRLQIRLAG